MKVYESEATKVFVSTGVAQVRQGDFRMVAPRLVLWLDKRHSKVKTRVRVFALGTGPAGQTPENPVYVVEGESAATLAGTYRMMDSPVGLSWDTDTKKVKEKKGLGPLFRRAREMTKGRDAFDLDTLPKAKKSVSPPSIQQVLQADAIHFFTDKEEGMTTVVYMGNVHGQYKNINLRADSLVLWIDQDNGGYEMYAEGDVLLDRKKSAPAKVEGGDLAGLGAFNKFRADELYINARRKRARASQVELQMDTEMAGPARVVVARGKEVYVLDPKNYVIEEVSVTHCDFGDPHYQIVGERSRIVRDDPHLFISTWDVGLETGRRDKKLLGLPFLSIDAGNKPGYLLRSVSVGSSDKYGMFVRTRWRLRNLGWDPDWMTEFGGRLDYFGDRGVGAGLELGYDFEAFDAKHHGLLRTYYVHDSKEKDDNGRLVPKEDRGRAWWEHHTTWNEQWSTDAEFYWLSDSGFLSEYFEEDFDTLRAPESYIYSRYAQNTVWAGFTYKQQVNDFITQVEEMPSGELQIIGSPLGDFVYDATFDAGVYDLEISDELTAADPPAFFRGHTDHRLSLPFSWGGVHFDPFVRAVGTWAGEGVKSSGRFGGSELRLGGGGGIRASMDLSRNFGVNSSTLQLNRLRHIMTPYVEAETLQVSTGSDKFIQLGGRDPWPRQGNGPRPHTDLVDGIDDLTEVRVGMRHRLQTKRRNSEKAPWNSVDWIDLDAAVVVRSTDSVRVPEDDNYIDLDFAWEVLDWWRITSEDNRFSLQDGVDVLNLGTSVDLTDEAVFGLAFHHISGESKNVGGYIRADLSDRYSLTVQESYEFDAGGSGGTSNIDTRVVLQRYFHMWVGSLIFRHDSGDQGNNTLMINFAPRGFRAPIQQEFSSFMD